MLLFTIPGLSENLLASGKLFAEGAGPPEAVAVEKPMVEQLGMLKGMDNPAKWTSGLNWYRCADWASRRYRSALQAAA